MRDRDEDGGMVRTVGVELQDVQVTVCVCNDDVELFAVRQEVGGDGFDMVWRFAEEAELVRVLLFANTASAICICQEERDRKNRFTYHVTS